jgi:hypothetical protein
MNAISITEWNLLNICSMLILPVQLGSLQSTQNNKCAPANLYEIKLVNLHATSLKDQ